MNSRVSELKCEKYASIAHIRVEYDNYFTHMLYIPSPLAGEKDGHIICGIT